MPLDSKSNGMHCTFISFVTHNLFTPLTSSTGTTCLNPTSKHFHFHSYFTYTLQLLLLLLVQYCYYIYCTSIALLLLHLLPKAAAITTSTTTTTITTNIATTSTGKAVSYMPSSKFEHPLTQKPQKQPRVCTFLNVITWMGGCVYCLP